MAWNYSGDPSTSNLDRLRFTIQDTVKEDPLLEDEELAFLLVNYSFYRAAAKACETIAMKFIRKSNKTVGPIRIEAGSKADKYFEMAKQFNRSYKIGTPYSGNMSKSEEVSDIKDTDLKQPTFFRKLMDNN